MPRAWPDRDHPSPPGLGAGRWHGAHPQRQRSWFLLLCRCSELANERADDIGIIVGPNPLVRVELLQRPKRRTGKGTEILVVAGDRRNRTDIQEFARVLVEVGPGVHRGYRSVRRRLAADQ